MSQSGSPLLEMRGITKRFPGLVALDHVDFETRRGEIHALIGQNGAGKSTLMKILAGVYAADSGQILIDGQPVRFGHPRDALNAGIGVVYQDLSLVPKLSVADNIFLGREPGDVVIDQTKINEQASHVLARLGVHDIDVRARLETLSLAQQQLVEIAKVLSYKPRILVMDEPTATLAEEETALLLNILRGLRAEDIGIIYISHRFKEILDNCDRATVLRNGEVVQVTVTAGVSEETLIELTIGEKISAFFQQRSDESADHKQPALEVENLSVGYAVRDVSFSLHKGEIVGITGLLGAGQNELARALFGVMPEVSGVIKRDGSPVLIHSPKAAIRLGIGLLTEHRKIEGFVPEMSVKENISLPSLGRFSRLGMLLVGRGEARNTQHYVHDLQIKAPSLKTRLNTLSGGNQQKVILAKWMLRNLDILIFIAPTQGIDVGAKAEIYQKLSELAAAGKTIIVVSEDHLEIMNIADRILVMYKGQLLRTYEHHEVTEERLLSTVQGIVE